MVTQSGGWLFGFRKRLGWVLGFTGVFCVGFEGLGVGYADENPAGVAVKEGERKPAEARIYADISYLASDDLRGRSAETPGLKLASE